MHEQVTAVAVWVAIGFEIVGVAVIIGGFFYALAAGIAARGKSGYRGPYITVRNLFGRGVLLGLEILVAADLVRTITVSPTLDNLLALGLLVIIRTFLSWSFEVELEGMWPWRKREVEAKLAAASDSQAP